MVKHTACYNFEIDQPYRFMIQPEGHPGDRHLHGTEDIHRYNEERQLASQQQINS